jgi:hypothetical protein
MLIKENSIKNVSSEFKIFKDFLDHGSFYTDFIIISFDYQGNNLVNLEVLKSIYPDQEWVNQNDKIIPIALSKVKELTSEGFHMLSVIGIRTEDTNNRLEELFWQKVLQYINILTAKIYTFGPYGDFTQWVVCFIFIDEENKKGLLVNAGAWD